jgi:alpha-beta hydrolase superfamily lysophospholipase
LLHSDVTPLKQLAARLLGSVLPLIRLSPELGEDHLARDPEVGRAYLADPLVESRWTLGLGAEMLRAMHVAESLPASMPVPTLVMHGEEDRVASPAATEPLAQLDGVDRIVFDGFRHEIHNEDGGVLAVDTISRWIEAQLGDQPG